MRLAGGFDSEAAASTVGITYSSSSPLLTGSHTHTYTRMQAYKHTDTDTVNKQPHSVSYVHIQCINKHDQANTDASSCSHIYMQK